jgi:uncharacterized damage-inducible protein DinB
MTATFDSDLRGLVLQRNMFKRRFLINFGATADHSLDYLLGIIDDARVTTLQRVEGVTVEELHWQYREGWNSIGALLAHITAIEHCFRIIFIEGRQFTEEENEKLTAGLEMGKHLPNLITGEPLETYIAGLAGSRKMLLEALRPVTFERFSERMDAYDPETGSNLAWILYHMAEDEVHHRGQISLLRKLYKDAAA